MSESVAAPRRMRARKVERTISRWSTPPMLAYGAGLESMVKENRDLAARVAQLADTVQFCVTSTTLAGAPIQNQRGQLNAGNYQAFAPRPDAEQAAIEALVRAGCKLVRRGRFSTTMSGPAALVEELIGGKLFVQARQRRTSTPSAQMFASSFEPPLAHDLFLAPEHSLSVQSAVSEAVDHLVFIPPPLYFDPSPNAPAHSYHSVDTAAIRRLLNVSDTHDGTGIKVAVIDSGFYPHPYYTSRNLNLRPVPTASAPNPEVDNHGHGTAICYNVFAVAPGVELLGFQQTDPPQDALEDAAEANADIISCSWGWENEQIFPVLQASLLSVIEEGRTVIFAAGNGQRAWPGAEPAVLSVGGVYADAADALQASDYASGYMSGVWPDRRVPDVCGLCGQKPRGIYIMMPTQPGNTMDTLNGGPAHPYQDGSTTNDGWVGASGTSSAAPQIAGVAALMIQAARHKGVALPPARVRSLLENTAQAVTQGQNAMGLSAHGHPNIATGWGLVDATAAVAAV